jgi:hypothetical protein
MTPTTAFDRARATGFVRGGGITQKNAQPMPDFDMMSVFTDDDATAQTTMSTVEARLAELQQANIEQNRIIAQQDVKIETMQQEHARQLNTLREEQANRLEQMSREHQERIDRLSEKQDLNTNHITDVMRETMREYMEAQMKAIIAEVIKTHICTPNNVDIQTQTTVSTTTQPPTPSSDPDEDRDNRQEHLQHGMDMENHTTTAANKTAKWTMNHTPDVSPVKGFGSIVPLRKLPVPPSWKLSYSTGTPPTPSSLANTEDDMESTPTDTEPDPGAQRSPGKRL